MEPIDELATLLRGGGRRIVVAEKPIDLRSLTAENGIYIFQMIEERGAAGGRSGGFGGRTLERIYRFQCGGGQCEKLAELDNEETVMKYEIPHYAARLPVTLPDGMEAVVYGVFDPDLVGTYKAIS
jgi:hypothetical protein